MKKQERNESVQPAGSSRQRKWNLAIVSAVVAVISVSIAYLQYQRAQRLFAITEIVGKWNENTGELKDAIELRYPGLYNHENFGQLKGEAAQALFNADKDSNPELYAVRQSVVELLNYFEYICIACESGVADERIVREFAGGSMKRWGRALEDFIKIYNDARGTSVWAPYYRTVHRWDPAIDLSHHPKR